MHLICNSLDFVCWKDRKAAAAALKEVYRALRIPRRRRWWTAISGPGIRSARQIEVFFASHPDRTERARALVTVTSPERIAPWERIHLPHEVDGSPGIYRAPRQM